MLASAMPGQGRARFEGSDQVCALVRNSPESPAVEAPLCEAPLGIPPRDAQIALQQDAVKELVNKLSWVLGSVYRASYSNMRTPARQYAWRIAKQVLKDHGYPSKISNK